MQLSFEIKELHLKETFSIAYGNYDMRKALLIKLTEHNVTGFGECVEINYYGINLQDFIDVLSKFKSKIESQKIQHPKDFHLFLKSLGLHSFLLSALDCAFWDLYGKLEHKSFAELNAIHYNNLVQSSYTISIDSIENQIKKINESHWQKFKVKCKGLDKKNIEALLKLNNPIALDSNASFTEEDCIWLQETPEIKKFSYIEQPLEIGHYNILKKNGFANWMADEDFQDLSYLEKLKPHYQCINIKLMKCGGLTPALEIIAQAKKEGFKIMVGCMTESTVGISADCAVVPFCDFADLDGANLISNDFATGSYVENGTIMLSEKPGLGIALK